MQDFQVIFGLLFNGVTGIMEWVIIVCIHASHCVKDLKRSTNRKLRLKLAQVELHNLALFSSLFHFCSVYFTFPKNKKQRIIHFWQLYLSPSESCHQTSVWMCAIFPPYSHVLFQYFWLQQQQQYIYLHFGLHYVYNNTFKILKNKWRPPWVTIRASCYRNNNNLGPIWGFADLQLNR